MEIRTFGVGGRIAGCERLLYERLLPYSGRLVLLPIPTSRDKKYITGTAVSIEEISALIEPGTIVVGYEITHTLASFCDERSAFIYDAALDEDFLSANAELTARGAIGYLITHTDRDLADMRVGVVGYGRIGSRLINLLLLFGAKVVVYTRRPLLALELCENGISALTPDRWDFSGIDLLINTAPARQVDEDSLPPDLDIIDLASGSIFPPSAGLVKLPSIPEQMFPISAGRLYAEAALRALEGRL